ncbi:MAG: T9SS type A sorting domain-containing protein [Bacteroidota bacterium]
MAPPLELPVDFNSSMINYDLAGFGGANGMISPDPTDPSNPTLAITKPPGSDCFGGVVVGATSCFATPVPFGPGNMVISMDVYSPEVGASILLKFENCTNGAISSEIIAVTTVANQWETLTFDFSSGCPAPPNPMNTYDKMIIFPQFTCDPDACGNPNPGTAPFSTDTYYFDNVMVMPVMSTDAPVTFCLDLSCDPIAPIAPSVISTFNMGNAGANILTDPDGDGVWCTTVNLAPGTYVYKFFDQAENPQREDLTGLPCTTTDPFFGSEEFRFVDVMASTPVTVTNGWESCASTCTPPLPPPDLPLTFDDQMMVQYNIANFGGMSSVLGVDPTDPSNAVVVSTKTPGAACFAGSILNDVVCLQNPVPFTADEMVMTVDVFSPAAGRGFLLKLEDCNNSAIATEVLAITTVANAWETLVFDFSMACPMPDLANSYSKIVVFPGWTCDPACGGPNGLGNTPGDGSIYYIDNIMMCGLPIANLVCPPNAALSCTDAVPAAATDEASFIALGGSVDNPCNAPLTVSSTDVMTMTGASISITRTYTVSDGTTTLTCDQMINLDDTTPPTVTCPPAALVSCDNVPEPLTTIDDFIAGGGSTSDDCAMLADLSLSVSQTTAGDVCPTTAQRTITRSYSITDLNNNTGNCTQTITILNSTIGPVITSIPPDRTIDCSHNAIPEPHLFDADSDCNLGLTFTVSEVQVSGTPNCPNSNLQYTYTATDDCGRTASHVQTYTIQNDPPEFVCPAEICIIDCPADTDMIESSFANFAEGAVVNTSCIGSTVVTDDFNPNGFFNQNCNSGPVSVPNTVAWQIVTFTATDQCGRTSTCTALVVIKDDDGAQIEGETYDAIRYDNDLAQSEYEAWANDNLGNLSVVDDCSGMAEITWSFSPASPNTEFVGPFATTEVSFIATDGCGNTSSVTAIFRLKEEPTANIFNISGAIMDAYNEEVENVEVSLSLGSQGLLGNMMTTSDGQFEFEGEENENYEISPYRNDDPLNGVSTMDLILISKHILGMELLDSPYKMIAADANNSGTITANDLVEIRKLILFITEAFSNSDSWRFVEEDYLFPEPNNPFAFTFPSIYSINGLTADQVANFIAIKIGDVNGNAVANQLAGAGDTRSQGSLSFQIDDQKLEAGQTYLIDFKAEDFNRIAGFQYSLNFDPAQIDFVDIHAAALPEMSSANFGMNRLGEGIITSSWNVNNAVSLDKGEVLFRLELTAKSAVQLSEVLQLGSPYTASEAYNDAVELLDLNLAFKGAAGTSVEPVFALYQNQPNPFADQTLISFNLPEAGEATLTIFDMSGRILYNQQADFAAGFNQISLDKSSINHTGLMYYTLQTNQNKATKKMIVLGN